MFGVLQAAGSLCRRGDQRPGRWHPRLESANTESRPRLALGQLECQISRVDAPVGVANGVRTWDRRKPYPPPGVPAPRRQDQHAPQQNAGPPRPPPRRPTYRLSLRLRLLLRQHLKQRSPLGPWPQVRSRRRPLCSSAGRRTCGLMAAAGVCSTPVRTCGARAATAHCEARADLGE